MLQGSHCAATESVVVVAVAAVLVLTVVVFPTEVGVPVPDFPHPASVSPAAAAKANTLSAFDICVICCPPLSADVGGAVWRAPRSPEDPTDARTG